jgi:F1F0 ATPase subunit 2
MSEGLWLCVSLVVGVALGGIYFGGLWWTVNRLMTAKNPAPIVLLSMGVRCAITIAGLYYLSDGRWLRIVVAMVGFIGVRIVLRRALGPERRQAGTETRSNTGS